MKALGFVSGSVVALNLALAPMALACGDESCSGAGHGAKKDVKQGSAPKLFDAPQKEGTQATCPVSGEVFVITKDTQSSTYNGKYVYFCCPKCKPTFDKDPEKYLKS